MSRFLKANNGRKFGKQCCILLKACDVTRNYKDAHGFQQLGEAQRKGQGKEVAHHLEDPSVENALTEQQEPHAGEQGEQYRSEPHSRQAK